MNLIDQLKQITETYLEGRESNIKYRAKQRKVKTKTLQKDLLQLRRTFLNWDHERRRKVDLVLAALEHEGKYVDIERVKKRLDERAEGDELLIAAHKMINIHYLDLSMTVTNRVKAYRRRLRAKRKLNKMKRRGP